MPERAVFSNWNDVIPDLRVGDILLISNTEVVSRVIRSITHSYWSHAAMVFEIMHPDAENRIVLIIEAMDKGIEIHRLRDYVNNLGARRIGVKRFPGLTDAQREYLRSFFLNQVDAPYDFSRIYRYFLTRMAKRLFPRSLFGSSMPKAITLDHFICSTFVQRALYLALPPGERHRAIFKQHAASNFLDQLEMTTPGDIAKSAVGTWVWNPHP